MKKIIFIIISFFVLSVSVSALSLAQNAKSAILVEFSTGKVLFEKDANARLAPASMTKIMTMLLVMDSIKNGNLNYDSDINISESAASMGGSQMYLEGNTTVKLHELLKGLAIASANDAAVALAENIGGSVENFVSMMNDKAKELNLTNTHFDNPHGLDSENHYSSAYDMAIMARELIKHEDILKYTSTYEDYFNKADGSRTWLVNTNKLVRFYEGVDGLKTGYTNTAKYCLTATAKKNNIRFITVLMGEESSELRNKETSELLNFAFSTYKLNTIISKDSNLGSIYVDKSLKEYVNYGVKEDINEVIKVNDNIDNYKYNIKTNKVKAPLKKNDEIGSVEILDKDNLIIKEVPLVIKEDVNKISFINILLKNIKLLLSGN